MKAIGRMPRPHDHVIFTDLNGLEGVLVDLNTRQYFQINESACLIWRGLVKGTSVADIARELTERYDVTLDHAQSSVETAVARFRAHRLVDSA